MKEILSNSLFFGVTISVLAYELGVLLKKKVENRSAESVADRHCSRDHCTCGISY